MLSLFRDESGSELVEFSLGLSLILTTMFALVSVSGLVYTQHYVDNAARAATRYAVVRGSYWATACTSTLTSECTAASSNIVSFVETTVPPLISTSQLSVVPAWPGTTATGAACDTINGSNGVACTVTVTVTYSYSFVLPFLPKKALTLTGISTGTYVE